MTNYEYKPNMEKESYLMSLCDIIWSYNYIAVTLRVDWVWQHFVRGVKIYIFFMHFIRHIDTNKPALNKLKNWNKIHCGSDREELSQ